MTENTTNLTTKTGISIASPIQKQLIKITGTLTPLSNYEVKIPKSLIIAPLSDQKKSDQVELSAITPIRKECENLLQPATNYQLLDLVADNALHFIRGA